MRLSPTASILAIAGLIGLAAPIAIPAQAQEAASPPAASVTGEEIDAFVLAYQSVIAIDADYTRQLEQTADDAQRQVLQQEAQARMTAVVEETPGIDVDRYVEILTLAQADPDLSASIVEKLEN